MDALTVVVTGARRIRRVGALAVALGLVASCSKELPTAPTELATGITIYEDANFLGDSALLTADASDLKDYDGPCAHQTITLYGVPWTDYDWSDCMSSIRVAPGWRATIYRDGGFKGESLEITADVPNLQLVRGSCDHDGLNDCITSIRVRRQ